MQSDAPDSPPGGYQRVITFGTFDLLHVGHIRILERAAALGKELVVGVSTDEFSRSKKGRFPVYSQDERAETLRALRCVDHTFFEESMEAKADYIRQWGADCLVMGDDWVGKFDDLVPGCDTVYLSRTKHISSTEVEEYIQTRKEEA